jgi:serine/threonine protein kinase
MEGNPFGRYQLLNLLGRGGMGEVWRARDSLTGDRVVAVKLLAAQLSHDEVFQRRFRREADAAARLNSPHVIPIHGYGEIEGRLYVDMRLIEGRDLQAVLAHGPLEPARAVRIIQQVAEALQAAHQIGLVHRDVKPSNILLDNNDFAYLIDFGIARAADQTALTGTGGMVGTLDYMAPERFRAGDVDARADIYALACVLYECLTGRRPYPADRFEQKLAAHLSEPPPRPSTAQPDVPRALDAVIARGMAKAPAERYPTTVDLARAASDAITDPMPRPAQQALSVPTTPAPTSTAPPGRDIQPPRQRPADVPPSAAPQPGPPRWAPPQQREPFQPFAQRPQVPAPRRRLRRRVIILAAAVLVILAVAAVVIGQIIIRSNYYVTASGGNVLIMRGIQGSLLDYPLQKPHLLGCINDRNDLSLISVGQSQIGCRLLKVDDLTKSARAQVVAGLPAGSLDDAINQMHKLVQQSLLPLCAPPQPSPPQPSPAPPPPTAPSTVTSLPPEQQPGTNCRTAA